MPPGAKPEIRELFRRYLETRIVIYSDAANEDLTTARLNETLTLQDQIWEKSLVAVSQPDALPSAAMLFLNSLNDMFDITSTRAAAMENHPPAVIFMLLVMLSLLASMLAGYVLCVSKGRNWFYMLLFTTTISLTLYVIVDMEYPRYGLIRVDSADQTLMDLRAVME